MEVGHVLRRALDHGVHAAARAMYLLPHNHPGRHGVRVVRDVPYKPTGSSYHLLDVYMPDPESVPRGHAAHAGPAEGELRPTVLYVHGGGFSLLSKDTHRVAALPFAKRGYVVFNINYRLGPVHTYPAPLEDAADALRWVQANAKKYGADPDRIILAGESAGGNLVTALTYMATHDTDEPFGRALRAAAPKIRATVPIYGFLDLSDMKRLTGRPKVPEWAKKEALTAASSYVGKDIEGGAARHPLASPLRLFEADPIAGAPELPPFFIACGTADMLLDDSRRLHAAIEKRGGKAELHVFHGEVHGFNMMLWRPAAKAKWRALFHFLHEAGV
jgi:acetyl esterase